MNTSRLLLLLDHFSLKTIRRGCCSYYQQNDYVYGPAWHCWVISISPGLAHTKHSSLPLSPVDTLFCSLDWRASAPINIFEGWHFKWGPVHSCLEHFVSFNEGAQMGISGVKDKVFAFDLFSFSKTMSRTTGRSWLVKNVIFWLTTTTF